MIKSSVSILILLLVIAFTLPSAHAQEESPITPGGASTLRVQVLSENRLLSPWYETSLAAFRQAMREEHGRTVSLQWDPINMARYADPAERAKVVAEFAANHPGPPPDLVLTLDSAAVFALEQKERFFPATPVVAITLEEAVLGGRRLPPDFSAVMQAFAPRQTVATALKLFPKLERLVVVNGRSPIEQAHGRSLRQALAPLAGRLQIEWLENLTYEETRARLSRLPGNSAVLFIRYFTDGTGRWFTPREVVGEFSRTTDAPIFVLWGTLLGTGALGGEMMDPTVEGPLAAEQASLLLAKRPAAPRMLPAVPIFDWRVMRRFDIAAHELPAGSEVRGKPPTIWEADRRELLFAGAVFASLLLAIAALVFNVAWRKRAEKKLLQRTQALRESEEQFRAVFEQAAVGMGRVGFADARWIDVNEAFCRMLGYSREEMRATPWPQMTHPEDVDLDLLPFRRMAAGELDTYSIEKRFIHRQGHPVWARLTLSLARDARGEPDYEIAVIENIGERKLAEEQLRQLTDNLERLVQERTASLTAANRELEAFTYTVSHDLRAPLRHIASFVELLGAEAGNLSDQDRRYITIIAAAARRMGSLIDDLLTFSRIGRAAMARTAIDVGQLVNEARRELAPETTGRNIDWVIGPLPEVHGDPDLLRTVLVNLLANAIKFTRERNPAQIEIGARVENREVICFVRDNGAGFDMRFADKLFGVFQRLHPAQEFEGTGIGLASVRRIIQRHGGRTWGEGEVDKGATFYFSLPE